MVVRTRVMMPSSLWPSSSSFSSTTTMVDTVDKNGDARPTSSDDFRARSVISDEDDPPMTSSRTTSDSDTVDDPVGVRLSPITAVTLPVDPRRGWAPPLKSRGLVGTNRTSAKENDDGRAWLQEFSVFASPG